MVSRRATSLNQIFTCVEVKLRLAASASRSAALTYF